MKIHIVFISLILVVSSKKDHHGLIKPLLEKQNRSEESLISLLSSRIDLRGTVRGQFAMEAALDHKNENLVCSPLLALMPLAKLGLGVAKNESRSHEVFKAIGVREKKIRKEFKDMIKDLAEMTNVNLTITCQIFIPDNLTPKVEFTKKAFKIFRSGLKKVNFSSPEKAAKQINDWVYKKTDNNIQDIVKASNILKSTSILIVNAIMFNGLWKYKFHSHSKEKFYSPNGELQVNMMMNEAPYKYHKSDLLEAQVLEIPYANDANLIVLLPFKRDGLNQLLMKLKNTPKVINKVLRRMVEKHISLKMPNFTIETELDLKATYSKVGLKRIFEKKSGLTALVRDDELHVSKAFQKSILQVSDKGTVEFVMKGFLGIVMDKPRLEVEVNRPFFFYIIAKKQILFAGQIIDPRSKGDTSSSWFPFSFQDLGSYLWG